MARTPLAQTLQEIAAEEKGLTRSDLFRAAGAAGAGVALAGTLGRTANAATAPRIAIVGAGLAGLSCALDLRRAGYAADIYEASDRIGGRCWTIRGAFAEGQIAEHGGELIDTGHLQIRQLAQSLGLSLDSLFAGEAKGTEMLGHFDGQPYTYDEATNDLKAIWQKLHADASAASYPTLWNLSTERGRELDAMSIVDWLDESVPGGSKSRLGQLLDVAYNIEYGAECSDQSSLNLIYLLAYQGPGNLRIFGKSNEKYHVRGGNDQITQRMADTIGPARISLGTRLVAIAQNGAGYDLTLSKGGSSFKVTADQVVLALPFSILRTLDYSKAGFEPRKITAIKEQGMGSNSKLHVQFSRRLWAELGSNGETYSDRGYQNTWDVTRSQPGKSGILVNYTGGTIASSFGSGTPAQRAQKFLGQIEPVLPGLSATWNGRATVDYWAGYQWTKGAYSYWKPGQYQKFAGMEGARQANCHFAGEHTSIDFQGYLNGAVESGQRAAAEILADFKKG
jgi:monoamine oxidase